VIFSGPNPPIVPVTFNNPGGSGLNPTATYSTDIGPDIVAKVSADPGWGHFEIYGLGRAFRSRANFSNHTILGGGVVPVQSCRSFQSFSIFKRTF